MKTASDKEWLDQARLARSSAIDLEQLLAEPSGTEWKIVVSSPTGDRAMVVTRKALVRFAEILAALGDGKDPSVVPMATELSTGELAELLGVSRQYAVRLLDDGRLPFRRVGNRRRVALTDALAYLRCDDNRRQESLRGFAASLIS
jgi:excisionase family DNA binding protein